MMLIKITQNYLLFLFLINIYSHKIIITPLNIVTWFL